MFNLKGLLNYLRFQRQTHISVGKSPSFTKKGPGRKHQQGDGTGTTGTKIQLKARWV